MSGQHPDPLELLDALRWSDEARFRDVLQRHQGGGADGVDWAVPDTGTSLLMIAAMNGLPDFVRLLLDAGASVTPRSHNGMTALWLTVSSWYDDPHPAGAMDVLQQLLAAGADPNEPGPEGEMPLHTLSLIGRTEVVRTLLAAGADANVVNPYNGTTPLILAARDGHAATCRALLEQGGAEVDWAHAATGKTALLVAAEAGSFACVQRLLAAGAAVDRGNAQQGGRTALHAAALGGHLDVARVLVAYGASLHSLEQQPGGGEALTPAGMARRIRRYEMLPLLEGSLSPCGVEIA